MAQGDAGRIAGLWEKRVRVARRVLPLALTDLRPTAEVTLQYWLTRLIYSIPEDVWPKSGKKKWTRTGRLRQGEQVAIQPRGADSVGLVITNRVPYAEPRHEAGKPGRKPTNRPAHWRDETLKSLRQGLRQDVQRAIRRIIQGGP
jgi:hypothetical protein